MLYVDAATYAVSFLLLAGFVPKTKKLGQRATHGVLAGIKFLVRDKLLGPLGATVIVLNFLGAMLSATLPFYAYDNFSGDSKIAGLFFTAMGAGAVIGSIAAVVVVKRFQPLRLAAIGIVALTVPLWLLPLDLPAWGVMAALFTAMLFTPLVNGPTIGVITARTPVDLRPKMMTALISISTLSAPAGFLVAGQLLEPWGVERVFAAVAIGMTGGSPRVRRDRAPPPRRGGAGGLGGRGLGGLEGQDHPAEAVARLVLGVAEPGIQAFRRVVGVDAERDPGEPVRAGPLVDRLHQRSADPLVRGARLRPRSPARASPRRRSPRRARPR